MGACARKRTCVYVCVSECECACVDECVCVCVYVSLNVNLFGVKEKKWGKRRKKFNENKK